MPELGPPKTRRCHVRSSQLWSSLFRTRSRRLHAQFFDSEGNQVSRGGGEYGCPRSRHTCHFIHPSDQEWNTGPAGSSLLSRIDNWRAPRKSSPPRSPTSSSASFQGHERRSSFSIDRHVAPTDSSSKRRRSPPRWGSSHHSDRDRSPVLKPRSPRRGASPPRDSRGSSNTNRDGRPLPHHASSNDRPHSFPQPDPPPLKSNTKPSLSKMSSDDRSHGKETKTLSPSGSLKSPALPAASALFKSPSEITSKTPSGPANAPSRSFSQVLPPPPSLPPVPPKDEMTPAERRAVWEKRVA